MNKDIIISELIKRLSKMEKAYAILEKENAFLQSKIVELESRLKSNSSNSSKPPSSDGYQKKPAFPKIAKGKKGGKKRSYRP